MIRRSINIYQASAILISAFCILFSGVAAGGLNACDLAATCLEKSLDLIPDENTENDISPEKLSLSAPLPCHIQDPGLSPAGISTLAAYPHIHLYASTHHKANAPPITRP